MYCTVYHRESDDILFSDDAYKRGKITTDRPIPARPGTAPIPARPGPGSN